METAKSCEFEVGKLYDSWNEFHERLTLFGRENGFFFTTLRSNPLHLENLKRLNINDYEKQELINKLRYNSVTQKCKLGPPAKTPVPRKVIKRVTRTFNVYCPVFITLKRIAIVPGNYKLKIVELNLNHENHPSDSPDLACAFPENRRLPPELREKVEDYLKMGCSNKALRCELSTRYNILVTSKDISNIKQSLRPTNSNDIPTFVNLLNVKYGCTTKIKTTNDNHFQALFFTNASMQNSMKNWPDMLFIDGTYKLFNLGFTLYLIMIQNGSGRGEIVGVSLLATETSDVMKWVAKTFREFNEEACTNTRSIMTDKDLTERSAFAESFPKARFLLCLFHTLKTFDRQLKSLKLTKEERSISFRLLRDLAYAKSQDIYDRIYEKLIRSVPERVCNYFNRNWHPNRDEWVNFATAAYNYGNQTNNIVESTNKQMKTECEYHSTLCEFAKNFFQVLSSSKQETHLLMVTDALKKLNIQHELGICVNDYADFLTKVAFNKLNEELNKYSSIIITRYCQETNVCCMDVNGYQLMSSITDCRCNFRTSLKLPCIHILAARKHFNLNLFCPELCDSKWSKAENVKKLDAKFHEVFLADSIFSDQLKTSEIELPKTHEMLVIDDITTVGGITEEINIKITSENERRRILQQHFTSILKNTLQATEIEFNKVDDELKKIVLSCQQAREVSHCTKNLNSNLQTVILPEPKILRGRPKSARKTTTGFFPRNKN